MKSLRIWLLVVLAVLLPLRGALAAAMLCPVAGNGVQAEVQGMAHAHEHTHAHGPASGDAATHGHASQAADSVAGDTADKCNLCSAFCSVTGMVAASTSTSAPPAVAALFPHLQAGHPSFIPDGQERPPRST